MKEKRKRIHIPKKRFTLMLLPHSGGGGVQVNISYFSIFVFFAVWLGITGTSFYFIAKKIDNSKTLAANKTLKNKLTQFSAKLEGALNLIQQTSELNTQLRGMLSLGDKTKIIEYSAAGGPSKLETLRLSKILFESSPEESEKLLNMNIEKLLASGWKTNINFRETSQYLKEERILALSTPAIWPVFGRVTSGFGMRADPFTGRSEFHGGFDVADAPKTPIRVTADGRVVFAGWAGNLGKAVIVSHRMGYTTFYGHCDEVFVKQGESVERGQIIADIGCTGRSTGYHVHYEIKHYGKSLNPKYFVERSF